MDQAQLEKVTNGKGFIAALDQSGGSTPKALKLYGIDEGEYEGETAMFDLMHAMRSRIITSPTFGGDRVLGFLNVAFGTVPLELEQWLVCVAIFSSAASTCSRSCSRASAKTSSCGSAQAAPVPLGSSSRTRRSWHWSWPSEWSGQ